MLIDADIMPLFTRFFFLPRRYAVAMMLRY